MEIQRPKPIAEQISMILRKRIRKEKYPPGSQLPSESELMAEFGVSRTTIRVATTALAAEHLIWRRQGDGTYVRKKALEHRFCTNGFVSFHVMIEESGREATIQGFPIEIRPATDTEASIIEIASSSPVLKLRQLHLADGQPAILATYLIPSIYFTEDTDQCDVRLPIQEFLNRYCKQEIAYMKTDISATLSTIEVMEAFHLPSPLPFLKFIDLFISDEDVPLVLSTVYFDNRILEFGLIRTWNS